jgi:hypothetical protein
MKMKRTVLAVALLAAAATASAAEITLFGRDNFTGRRLRANDTIANLANSGFNDRATSAIVRDGVWQLCDDAYFRGRCVSLQPGRYPSLREIGLDNRISSVREIGDWGPPPRPGGGGPGGPGHGGWGGGSRAILYSNPDFHGERYVVEGNMLPDLANTGFNDRAQSLRVEPATGSSAAMRDSRAPVARSVPGVIRTSAGVSTTRYRPGAGSRTTTRTMARRTGVADNAI